MSYWASSTGPCRYQTVSNSRTMDSFAYHLNLRVRSGTANSPMASWLAVTANYAMQSQTCRAKLRLGVLFHHGPCSRTVSTLRTTARRVAAQKA